MSSLSQDQKKFYENTLAVTKREIGELEGLIQDELAKVKDRLAELQNARRRRADVRRGCLRLGIPTTSKKPNRRADEPRGPPLPPGAAPTTQAPPPAPEALSSRSSASYSGRLSGKEALLVEARSLRASSRWLRT